MPPALPKDELIKLDSRIDSCIDLSPFSKLGRTHAILHLMREYAYIHHSNSAGGSKTHGRLHEDRMRDALHWAQVWSYGACKADATFERRTKFSTIEIMYSTFQAANSYSSAFDMMNLLWRGWQLAEKSGDDTISVNFRNDKQKQQELADHFTSVPEPDPPEETESLVFEMLHKMQLRKTGPHAIEYEISASLVRWISQNLITKLEPEWHLNPDWDFGGYSVLEFRNFWTSLNSYAFAHLSACNAMAKNMDKNYPFPFDSAVPYFSKKVWIKKLSEYSELSMEKVSAILADLQFDYALCDPQKKDQAKTDVIYQPFVALDKDKLALNAQLVVISSAERNHWALLSILKKDLFSELSSMKEDFWLSKLKPFFEKVGIECASLDLGGKGNIDLLLVDRNDKFAVAAELKFLIAPDRIKHEPIKEIEKGQVQTNRSVKWLKENPEKASEKLKVNEADLARWTIEPLVITKNSMFLAYMTDEVTPIINEALLQWIIGDPHRRNLRSAWKVAKAQSFLPLIGEHFKESRKEIKVGDIVFVGTELAPTNEWDFHKDIIF